MPAESFMRYGIVRVIFWGVVRLTIATPWEGGQYGFVRNPRGFGGTVLNTHFHEGMDIRPLQLAANGEPLDAIHAIAGGTVVYVNNVPSYSNYGRYIVIEHQFGGCPYYSLYAHLSAVHVAIGERVSQGDEIAVMGHTGEGIDRERSHVHLELNILLNADFDRWSKKYFQRDGNRHGNFNGQNLDGLDIGRLYLELSKNPEKTILTWVRFSPYPYALQTRGYIEGSGPNYRLSKEGERYLDLISPTASMDPQRSMSKEGEY